MYFSVSLIRSLTHLILDTVGTRKTQQCRKFSLLEYFYLFQVLIGKVAEVSCRENLYLMVFRHGRLVTLSRSGKVRFYSNLFNEIDPNPICQNQVNPSKMKLDDLIRTSLMVMAVARANEQQSVIR